MARKLKNLTPTLDQLDQLDDLSDDEKRYFKHEAFESGDPGVLSMFEDRLDESMLE